MLPNYLVPRKQNSLQKKININMHFSYISWMNDDTSWMNHNISWMNHDTSWLNHKILHISSQNRDLLSVNHIHHDIYHEWITIHYRIVSRHNHDTSWIDHHIMNESWCIMTEITISWRNHKTTWLNHDLSYLNHIVTCWCWLLLRIVNKNTNKNVRVADVNWAN